MNKKQNYSAILAGIAITAILVASSLIAGNQFTQQANAQANATSSTPSTPRPAATQQQPRIGQTVNWQGTVSSIPSPLAGHNRENVAIVLPLRTDGGLYTGVVTFTASKGVQVQVWNVLSGVSPTTTIGRDFGELAISPSPGGKPGTFVATTEVGGGGRSDTSGSVPFAGNALALVGRSPFIATYSVTAQATAGKVTNNLTSATALATAAGGALGGAAAAAPPSLGGTTAGGTQGSASTLGGESSSSTLGGGPSGGRSSSNDNTGGRSSSNDNTGR